MSTNLTVIYERGEDGYWLATIPEFPGAFSQGLTRDEARENVLDALMELMAARRDLALKGEAGTIDFESVALAT